MIVDNFDIIEIIALKNKANAVKFDDILSLSLYRQKS